MVNAARAYESMTKTMKSLDMLTQATQIDAATFQELAAVAQDSRGLIIAGHDGVEAKETFGTKYMIVLAL